MPKPALGRNPLDDVPASALAAALGRKGGQSKSERKAAASRANGKKPKKARAALAEKRKLTGGKK